MVLLKTLLSLFWVISLTLCYEVSIPMLHGCGNIELEINFMKPTIIVYDA